MNIESILNKYRQLKVASAISPCEQQLISLFKEVDLNIPNLVSQKVSDSFTATLLFSEMSIRKIGELAPLCTYYYGSICQERTIPNNQKINALHYRLISFFKNIGTFDRFICLAHSAPMMEYRGNLSYEAFLDFLIMADAYKVWNTDLEDKILISIQRQVQQRESYYSNYTKQAIIREGNMAHEALLNAVKMALQIY